MPINMSWTACNMYVSVCQSADKSGPNSSPLRVCLPPPPLRLLPLRTLPSGLGLGLGRAKKDPELRATGLTDVLRRDAPHDDDDRYRNVLQAETRWSDIQQGCRRYLASVDVCRSISILDQRYHALHALLLQSRAMLHRIYGGYTPPRRRTIFEIGTKRRRRKRSFHIHIHVYIGRIFVEW